MKVPSVERGLAEVQQGLEQVHLTSGTFDSASGLKPMSAYVVVAAVLCLAAWQMYGLASAAERPEGYAEPRREWGALPAYQVEDREGRVLAASVPSYDLLLSPRAMWQAHTPERIAARLAGSMQREEDAGFVTALRDAMLPADVDGWRVVEAWELSEAQAGRIDAFLGEHELAGWYVAPFAALAEGRGLVARDDQRGAGSWRLVWEPRRVLSAAERDRHGDAFGPRSWTRFLARGLWAALQAPPVDGQDAPEFDVREDGADVWRALIPEVEARPFERIPPEVAMDVAAALVDESVAHHQMRLAPRADREHPVAEFTVLGQWGFTEEGQRTPAPYVGLELTAAELLQAGHMPWIERQVAAYVWRPDRVSRKGASPYFLTSVDPAEPVAVRTTIDARLQGEANRILSEALEEFDAAIAMAVVLDVASGEVLALDSVSRYRVHGFPPVSHLFTPGSTFKLVTMAMALEAGLVTPTEPIDVGNGREFRIPRELGNRVVREARGAPSGVIRAADCVAESSNAGMIQIGLRLTPEQFRGKLVELGYGQKPGAGLGHESVFPISKLEDWKVRDHQVSMSFGHQVMVSMWQQAEALSCILRGGTWKPLSLVREVRQGDLAQTVTPTELGRPAPYRVFSEETSAQVRAMMTLGAREGTGKKIVRPDIEMGSKTGTTEKERGSLSTHVELGKIQELIATDTRVTNDEWSAIRKELKRQNPTDGGLYTSSIVVVGHLPDPDPATGIDRGWGREVMVYVTIEEPRNREKFGSRVAGPTAMKLLGEALGLTTFGAEPVVRGEDAPAGFLALDPETAGLPEAPLEDAPWSRFVTHGGGR